MAVQMRLSGEARGRGDGFHFSGPGMENLDATISREFTMREKSGFEFRAEAFNVFNHAQFFGPARVEGNLSSGSFGHAVNAMAPRMMQIAVRYRFYE